MSKKETPLTRAYWKNIGGTLIEEFPAVRATKDNGPRYIDAVIILGEETKKAKFKEVKIKGKDVICVQTKAGRLGMCLMGQALFSEKLMRRFEPRSIKSVVSQRYRVRPELCRIFTNRMFHLGKNIRFDIQ